MDYLSGGRAVLFFWATNEPRLTDHEYRILMYLLQFPDPVRPTKTAIRDATGIKAIASVDRALKALRTMGALSWARGGRGTANSYTLHPPSAWTIGADRNSRLHAGTEREQQCEDDQLASLFSAI